MLCSAAFTEGKTDLVGFLGFSFNLFFSQIACHQIVPDWSEEKLCFNIVSGVGLIEVSPAVGSNERTAVKLLFLFQ